MTLWAVVPAKPLGLAKSRLAPVLGPEERAALARALLADVVAALTAAPGLVRVAVVSADAEARAVGVALGALGLPEPAGALPDADPEARLNAALEHAAVVAERASAAGLLVLPADVPLVTAADVGALRAALPEGPGVVVAPTADGGTGALLRVPPSICAARFGAGSLDAHLRTAAARGVLARVVVRPNLQFDVDRPADLLRLLQLPQRTQTQALLAAWCIEPRLREYVAAEAAADATSGWRASTPLAGDGAGG